MQFSFYCIQTIFMEIYKHEWHKKVIDWRKFERHLTEVTSLKQSFTCVRHIIVKYSRNLNCGVFKYEVPLNLREDKFLWYDGCMKIIFRNILMILGILNWFFFFCNAQGILFVSLLEMFSCFVIGWSICIRLTFLSHSCTFVRLHKSTCQHSQAQALIPIG